MVSTYAGGIVQSAGDCPSISDGRLNKSFSWHAIHSERGRSGVTRRSWCRREMERIWQDKKALKSKTQKYPFWYCTVGSDTPVWYCFIMSKVRRCMDHVRLLEAEVYLWHHDAHTQRYINMIYIYIHMLYVILNTIYNTIYYICTRTCDYVHTLHYITLHYITLHYITLHYITLFHLIYITLHYITLHYIRKYIYTYISRHIPVYVLFIWKNITEILSQNCCKWMGTPTWTSPVVPILLLLSQPRCSSMVALADPAPRSKVKNFDLHGSVPNLCEARCSSAVLLHWHSHFDDGIWLMRCCHILRDSCQGYHHVACHNFANLHSRQMRHADVDKKDCSEVHNLVDSGQVLLVYSKWVCLKTGHVPKWQFQQG